MGHLPEAAPHLMVEDGAVPDVERPQTVSQLIQTGRDHEAARRGMLEATRNTSPVPRSGEEPKGLMDPLTQFRQLGPVLGGLVAQITPDQLTRKTPCIDFTVRGVLEHMISGATAFSAAYRGETPREPDLSDPLGGFHPALGDLVAAIAAPGALARTIAGPFGALPGETFARYVVLDGLVHGWDMATATGQSYEPPEAVVAAADAFARQIIDPLRDGQTFADALEPAHDASPIERLAAYTGRRPPT